MAQAQITDGDPSSVEQEGDGVASPVDYDAFHSWGQRLGRPIAMSGAWIGGLVLFSRLFGTELDQRYSQWQIGGLGAASVLVVALLAIWQTPTLKKSLRPDFGRSVSPRLSWLGLFLVIVVAVGLRFLLLRWIPADYTSFEELQMGGQAQAARETGGLGMLFRITTAMAAAGLSLMGNEIAGLRWFFALAGAVSIVFVILALRRLQLGWPAVIVGAAIMASLRWLVLGGGVADELFSSMVLAAGLLTALIFHHTSERNYRWWAGLAGLAAGLLFYEYDSYKPLVVLPLAFWVVRAITVNNRIVQRRLLRSGTLWVTTFTFIAAPGIRSILVEGERSPLVDGFVRNRRDRATSGVGFDDSIRNLRSAVNVVFGRADELSSLSYRTPDDSVVPFIVGILFFVGLVDALRRPRSQPLLFGFGLLAAAMIFTSAALTLRFNPGRLTAVLPILVILSAVAVDRLCKWLTSRAGFSRAQMLAAATLLAVVVTGLNIEDVRNMRDNERSQLELANDAYTACEHVEAQPWRFETVMNHNPGHICVDDNDHQWLHPDLEFDSLHVDVFGSDVEIPPATLVILSNTSGLQDNERDRFEQLAASLDAGPTLVSYQGIRQRTVTMMFCHECDLVDGVNE